MQGNWEQEHRCEGGDASQVGEEASVSEYVGEGCADHCWVQTSGQIYHLP